MRSTVQSVAQILLAIGLCGTMPAKVVAEHPDAPLLQVATVQDSSPRGQLTGDELFTRLREHRDWQRSHLGLFSVVRTYTVQNEKGVAVAQEVVEMKYSPPGTEAFTVISANGSGFVRGHVFAGLMRREVARIKNRNDADALITPENYKFEMVRKEQVGSFDCIVVHAVPKHKRPDLFEGEIWIDSQDFAIVRIKGSLAKAPSFWIKRVDFERQYEKTNGFFVLQRETAIANIRIYGRRTLTLDCRDYSFADTHVAERAQ